MTTLAALGSALLNCNFNGIGYRGTTYLALQNAGVPAAEVLATVQAYLACEIDVAAEALRASWLTPGVGQILEYQEMLAEANAALAAPAAATPALYPMLAATIGIDIDPNSNAPAVDVLGVARNAVATYQAFVQAGAAIRKARMAGKAAVAAATTVAAAAAAVDAIAWPAASGTPAT